MIATQFDLFNPNTSDQYISSRRAQNMADWLVCWNWRGPVVGKTITFGDLLAEDIHGKTHYVTGNPARVLEVGDTWALVEYISTVAWTAHMDGVRFKLDFAHVWFDYRNRS